MKFFFLLFFCQSLWGLTLGEIIQQSRLQLGDTPDKKLILEYTDEQLTDFANIVQRDIVATTRILEGRSYIDSEVGVKEYDWPNDAFDIVRVAWWISPSTTAFQRLEQKDIATLDTEVKYWENTSSGTPRYYYLRANKIGFYPPFGVSYSTNSGICIDYLKIPDTLADSDDIPFDGIECFTPYHYLIVRGILVLAGRFDLEASYEMLKIKMKQEIDENPDRYNLKLLFPRE